MLKWVMQRALHKQRLGVDHQLDPVKCVHISCRVTSCVIVNLEVIQDLSFHHPAWAGPFQIGVLLRTCPPESSNFTSHHVLEPRYFLKLDMFLWFIEHGLRNAGCSS